MFLPLFVEPSYIEYPPWAPTLSIFFSPQKLSKGCLYRTTYFAIFSAFFFEKTGNAGETGNISNVWKFTAKYLERFAFIYNECKKHRKYGNTQNCANNKPGDLEKNPSIITADTGARYQSMKLFKERQETFISISGAVPEALHISRSDAPQLHTPPCLPRG